MRGHPHSLACGLLPSSKSATTVQVLLKLLLSDSDLSLPSFTWRDCCDYTEPTWIIRDNLPPQDPSLNHICKGLFVLGRHTSARSRSYNVGLSGDHNSGSHISSLPTHHPPSPKRLDFPPGTSFFKISYLFLATLGLCCCMRAFSSCSEQGLLSSCGA